ncbi:Uncharacterised protein [Salmonella enterica subsp. enterica serovar Typhimurium str. DT104]|nr:Uncharacterised protein [Salmonella enterica subsp. enterica serovar Typhimurium str. DT104]CQS17805.1 Uncharacterised protein [Salmonella enterica subsp. enterica serovar Typhi]
MIVAVIAVGAVAIFLTVRLIVFLIETDAVPERKTVMRREQIDRGAGRAAIAFKHIAGSGETTGKLPGRQVTRQPESAGRIAKMIVPLGKRWRKIPDLIAALANIPRFSNQLDR